MADPKYVRLADHLAVHGCQFDLESGFGISGFDVVPWPKTQAAQEYARAQVRRSVFEEASESEYKEVRDSDPDLDDGVQRVALVSDAKLPEHEIRERINVASEKVAKRAAARQEERLAAEVEEALDGDEDNIDDDELAGDAQTPTPREKAKAARNAPKGGKKAKE